MFLQIEHIKIMEWNMIHMWMWAGFWVDCEVNERVLRTERALSEDWRILKRDWIFLKQFWKPIWSKLFFRSCTKCRWTFLFFKKTFFHLRLLNFSRKIFSEYARNDKNYPKNLWRSLNSKNTSTKWFFFSSF